MYNGILFNLKKEANPTISDNMDEPGRHYAKWNKPGTERQRLHDHTNMWNIKKIKYNKAKLIVTEIRIVVTRGWDIGEKRRFKIIIMKRESRIVFSRAEGLESWGFIYWFRVSALQNENSSGEGWWW